MITNLLLIAGALFWSCDDDRNGVISFPNEEEKPIVVDKYQSISLNLNANGGYSVDENNLKIELYGINALYGVCLPELAEGHFVAETTCKTTNNKSGYGLAVIQTKDGRPDYNNFVSITVSQEGGYPLLEVFDRQNGTTNVLDNTGAISGTNLSKRYSLLLNGKQYSVPFTKVNGKVRILKNALTGFFHFYVGVEKEVGNVTKEDWIELAQSKDWAADGQKFLVAPVAITRSKDKTIAEFTDTQIRSFSPTDITDEGGFNVKRREYTWAGFQGNAVVISFAKDTKLGQEGRKFVFWDQANYVPHWHMDNNHLFSYEFVEVWSNKGIPGCFEPMSDRLRRFSKVEITEDTELRKIIKWNYTLINPDYLFPASGIEAPEVEETYTIYPDGVGTRHIKFRQKTDGGFESRHELAEPMVIAGSNTKPSDHFAEPALSVYNLSGARYDLHPNRTFNDKVVEAWTEQIYLVNLKSAPSPFCVFSFDKMKNPSTAPLAVTPEFTWHQTSYQMSHFPIDKQPYLTDYDKSMATFPSQVSHSSVIGIEAYGDTGWGNIYETDQDGRKYRVYISLIGLSSEVGDVDKYTATWLYDGTVATAATYKGVDHTDKTFVFQSTSGKLDATFSKTVSHPVIKIEGKVLSNVTIKIDGAVIANAKVATIANNTYFYIPQTVDKGKKITIE